MRGDATCVSFTAGEGLPSTTFPHAARKGREWPAFTNVPRAQLCILRGEIGAPDVVPQSFSFRLGAKAPDYQTSRGSVHC